MMVQFEIALVKQNLNTNLLPFLTQFFVSLFYHFTQPVFLNVMISLFDRNDTSVLTEIFGIYNALFA